LQLPALLNYQRDMHIAHRRLSQSALAFIRQMEGQMTALGHSLDHGRSARHMPGGGEQLRRTSP
jgi:hypothetical protein